MPAAVVAAAVAVLVTGVRTGVDEDRLRTAQAEADARTCLSMLERSSAATEVPALLEARLGAAATAGADGRLWLRADTIDDDPVGFYDRATAALDAEAFRGPPWGAVPLLERCADAAAGL